MVETLERLARLLAGHPGTKAGVFRQCVPGRGSAFALSHRGFHRVGGAAQKELLQEDQQALADLLRSGLDARRPHSGRPSAQAGRRCEDTGLHTGAALLTQLAGSWKPGPMPFTKMICPDPDSLPPGAVLRTLRGKGTGASHSPPLREQQTGGAL